MTLSQPVVLTNAQQAWVEFWTRWDIEDGYDYCVFEVSTDNGSTWIPQCGQYTTRGSADQLQNEPLYDGTQNTWVKEYIDLSDYLGLSLKFRFRMVSDSYVNADGFYFDDFTVNAIIFDGMEESVENNLTVYPNPATSELYISNISSGIYFISDATGHVIMRGTIDNGMFNVSDLAPGLYFVTVLQNGKELHARFVKAE
ncbi:Immune inhibitor A peptidase M6 [anaerobic digester metagenome]